MPYMPSYIAHDRVESGLRYPALMRREIVCDGCGEVVTVSVGNNSVSFTREPDSGRASGRVTICVRSARVHQCADGAFHPASVDATAKPA